MSLFDATVRQVVKDVSDKTLIPVPNRCSADDCKILSLVERKTRSWHLPWKSAYKYIPAELTLNDVLVESVDVKHHQSSSILFQNYASTPSYHRAGKIGGKIAEEFDVDVSVNETMEVSLKLGNVMKQEVVWQKLYDSVNGKVMQTDHPLLKLIKNSPKRSLFLIGMVVTSGLATDSIITDTNVDGNLGGSPQVTLNLNTSASSDTKQHRQYTIPLGTTLAYSCYRVKVDNNGALNLQLGDDLTDAPFVREEKILEVETAERALNSLLTNEINDELIPMLRRLLKNRPTCAFKLDVFVENAIYALEDEDTSSTITVQHLEKTFSDDCFTECFKILEKAGFGIDKEKNKLVYPEKLDLLKSLDVLLDCLSEMSSAQLQALTECDISHRNDLMLAIQKAIEERADASQIKIEFSEDFTDDHPVVKFLRSLGVDLVKSDSSFAMKYLPRCQPVIQLRSTLVAVFGMCSV